MASDDVKIKDHSNLFESVIFREHVLDVRLFLCVVELLFEFVLVKRYNGLILYKK